MKYLLKKTYTALRSNGHFEKGYTETWYSGKNRSDKELCGWIIEDGYTRKHFVEKKIQDDKEFEVRMGQDFWKIDYEIIEIQG